MQDQFRTYRLVLLYLLLLLVPAVLKNSLWWHPDGLVLLFAVLALFFLWKDGAPVWQVLPLGSSDGWHAHCHQTHRRVFHNFHYPLALPQRTRGLAHFQSCIPQMVSFPSGITAGAFVLANHSSFPRRRW
jgi:hypothetical protein